MSATKEVASHTIGAVVRRTGLSQHVIRVWEKRYKAITPYRTETNRRLYRDSDVVRLNLLKQLIDNGHRIGNIANEPKEVLEKLIKSTSEKTNKPKTTSKNEKKADVAIRGIYKRIEKLDAEGIEEELSKITVEIGISGTLHQVILPLVQKIGQEWADGNLLIAQEHIATSVIRDFLGSNTKPYTSSTHAPEILVGTPVGQIHELGAVLVSAVARITGWKSTFLGASMPASEFASAVKIRKPKAIAISIVFPHSDPDIEAEILSLSKLIPKEVTLFFGGRAATSYATAIKKVNGVLIKDLKSFQKKLEALSKK